MPHKNAKEKQEYFKKYRAEHKEEQRSYNAQYCRENREKIKARRKCDEAHIEKARASRRKWYQGHKEKYDS